MAERAAQYQKHLDPITEDILRELGVQDGVLLVVAGQCAGKTGWSVQVAAPGMLEVANTLRRFAVALRAIADKFDVDAARLASRFDPKMH